MDTYGFLCSTNELYNAYWIKRRLPMEEMVAFCANENLKFIITNDARFIFFCFCDLAEFEPVIKYSITFSGGLC